MSSRISDFGGTFSRSSLELFGKELYRGCRRNFFKEFVGTFSRSSLELFLGNRSNFLEDLDGTFSRSSSKLFRTNFLEVVVRTF